MASQSLRNLLLTIFLLFVFCFIPVNSFFRQSSPEAKKSPALPQREALTNPAIRLATHIQNLQMMETFKKHAKPNDVVEIRLQDIDEIPMIDGVKKVLIYGKNDDEDLVFKTAKDRNFDIIGYNLEDARISKEELVEKEKVAYHRAKTAGLVYAFAPLAIHVEKYGPEIAQHADIIAIQLRNYQLSPDFEQKVKTIVKAMKNANPDIEIWGQFDVNPRIPNTQGQKQPATTEEIMNEITTVEDVIDVIDIYYPRSDAKVAAEVVMKLRE